MSMDYKNDGVEEHVEWGHCPKCGDTRNFDAWEFTGDEHYCECGNCGLLFNLGDDGQSDEEDELDMLYEMQEITQRQYEMRLQVLESVMYRVTWYELGDKGYIS